jgi:CRP-like cAMP-binding protein
MTAPRELPEIPLLGALPAPARAQLRSALVLHHITAGAPIITAGSTDHALYILLSGTAAVSVGSWTIAVLSTGSLVGELGFFERYPERSADVIAQTDVHAACLERPAYATLCQNAPAAAAGLERVVLGALIDDLAATNRQISSLITSPPGGALSRLRRLLGGGR